MNLETVSEEAYDPEIERLERVLEASTPAVIPPSLGVLERIRERRRRRRQAASTLGAVGLIVGSIALGGLVVQLRGDSLLGTEAVLSSEGPDAVEQWLTDLPPDADESALFVASATPSAEATHTFIACAWIAAWVSALENGDIETSNRSLDALARSEAWVVSSATDGRDSFADLVAAARSARSESEAEQTALARRCG